MILRLSRLLFVTALFVAGQAARASESWHVTTWTTDDALPQGTVYAIHQTRDGYLWITTLGGLVRYDGVEFTVFERATTPGLRSNRFATLFEGTDGTLWAGTDDGFVTRYRDGTFTTFTVDGSQAPVYALSARGTSLPWAFTSTGLFVFDGAKFVRSGAAPSTREFLYLTGSAAVDASGVTVLEPGRPPQLLPFPSAVVPGKRRTVSADDRSLWIVDADRGIFRFQDGALRQVDHPRALDLVRNATEPAAGLPFIGAFTRSRDGAFWIAQSSRGIARVDGQSVEWITQEDGLAGLGVTRIFEDRDGTIWATTRGSGISAIRRRPARTYGADAGLSPAIAYPILPHDGGLLVGSWGGGLYRFDGQRFRHLSAPAGWVLSVAHGGVGTLWVSTRQSGVHRVRGNEVRSFGIEDGLPSAIVSVIYRARNGRMWFGTAEGLATTSGEGRFTAYRMASPASSYIQTIAEEPDGALLLGTRGGLLRFRGGRVSVLANEGSGLSSGSVRALHIDTDGTIWIGTYDGGLNRLRNGRLSAITTRQGLFDNGVFAIIEDAGFFWMSSNRGVHRASRRELNAIADGEIATFSSLGLTRDHGLLSAECNGGVQPAAARTADGRLWFPTQRGIVAIDPRLVATHLPPPLILISGISVDGEWTSPAREVPVRPGSRRVEFRFAAPTTVESRLTRYRYKLEGFDSRWIEVVGERVAAYTSLPPGRYRFLVSASNATGIWSAHPATAGVRVFPPFWRTWWFLVAAGVTAALLLWAAYRLRIRGIQREQAAQAAFSQRLLTQQEEERKRVASELHDSLGQSLLIIKNRALMGIDQDAVASEQLSEISSTASSAIDEVRRIAHNLRPVELDHLGLTKSLEVLMRRMSSSSPILFSGDLEPVDRLLTREAEVNVFRIVQEWLSNVARHSQASAAVVSLRREDHKLRLRIQDDGSGFTRAKATQEQRLGIGLRSIAERVQMLGGTYDIQSAPGQGTAMTIEVPLQEEGP